MSDLISRSKIYDYIKTEINPYGKPFEGTAYELGLKLMEHIEQMDDVSDVTDINVESKWIPCSERMPSEQDYPEQKYRVLASCSDGIVRNASIKSMLNGEKKYALGHIEFTYEAWMPLPPAFKGE